MRKVQIHTEVVTTLDGNGGVASVELNAEDSASWAVSHTYDYDGESWVEDRPDELVLADTHIQGLLNGEAHFAAGRAEVLDVVLAIMDDHTGYNGWDIGMMAVLAQYLADNGRHNLDCSEIDCSDDAEHR